YPAVDAVTGPGVTLPLLPYTALFRSAAACKYSGAGGRPVAPRGRRSKPALALVPQVRQHGRQHHQADRERVAGEPVEFRHVAEVDRKSTRLDASHEKIAYAVCRLHKK